MYFTGRFAIAGGRAEDDSMATARRETVKAEQISPDMGGVLSALSFPVAPNPACAWRANM